MEDADHGCLLQGQPRNWSSQRRSRSEAAAPRDILAKEITSSKNGHNRFLP